MDRRKFVLSTAAIATAGALTRPSIAKAQSSGPLRIGLLAPLTGVVAEGGREMVNGFKMYWDQNGNEVAGRKIDIIVEDDGSNPDTALQKARRLVENQKVEMLFGDLLANTGLAVANYVKGNGTPYFIPIIAADELTQRHRIPNVIRVAGYSASQMPRPLADWCLKQGYRRVATVSQDYTFGHEQCGGFCQTFTEGGGKVLGQLWHPINTSDFSPYIGQLASLGVDVVFAMETGSDATRLIQQYNNFGLKGKIPLVAAMNVTDQSVIRTMGAEAEGIVSAAQFAEGADNPKTQEFVREYAKRFNKLPSLYAFTMYSGAMWVKEALQTVKGNAEDREAFLKAVMNTRLSGSPLGKDVTLDAYGNPIYDVYIRKVEKRPDGKFWNVPIATYPGVSQFWHYDPKKYMQQKPYSRNFQGYSKS
jgi:branched-chain amino acid transport system substrate-binding protein